MSSIAYAQKKGDSAEKKDPQLCKKRKLNRRGRPNRISVIASMNAIISWIKTVNKSYGSEYGDWHRAQSAQIKCEKVKGSDYYVCSAAGKPCKKEEEKGNETEKLIAPKSLSKT